MADEHASTWTTIGGAVVALLSAIKGVRAFKKARNDQTEDRLSQLEEFMNSAATNLSSMQGDIHVIERRLDRMDDRQAENKLVIEEKLDRLRDAVTDFQKTLKNMVTRG